MATIKHKRSTVKGRVPSASSLQEGELALNLADKKLFTKSGSSVIELGSSDLSLGFEKVYSGGAETWFAKGKDGCLWAWGRNRFSNFGIGSNAGELNMDGFHCVPLPYDEYEFVDAYPCVSTCYAVMKEKSTGNHYMWAWGRNSEWQCGLGHATSPVYIPTMVTTGILEEWWFPTNIDFGERITVFFKQRESGRIMAFGSNYHGRVGDGTTTVIQSLKLISVPGIHNDNILRIWNIGGSYGRTYVQTKSNKLFASGYNVHGQLGINSTTNTPTWTEVRIDPIRVRDLKDIQGTSGWHNTSQGDARGATFFHTDDQIFSCGSDAYDGSGREKQYNYPVLLNFIKVKEMFIGTHAGCHYASSTDNKLYYWGASTGEGDIWGPDIKVGEADYRKYIPADRVSMYQDTQPTISFKPSGYYQGYFRTINFWWHDGSYWSPTSNMYGDAANGYSGADKYDPDKNMLKFVPIAEDENLIQMIGLGTRKGQFTIAVTDKGSVYGVGHCGVDWSDLASIYNQSNFTTNSTWQRLI